MLEDKEMLMHQLSVVRFLSEGEGGEVILSTTPTEEHLNMHGSSRLFFHWQQQDYCCYQCDRHYLQIIFLLAQIPPEISQLLFLCLVCRSMCQSPVCCECIICTCSYINKNNLQHMSICISMTVIQNQTSIQGCTLHCQCCGEI